MNAILRVILLVTIVPTLSFAQQDRDHNESPYFDIISQKTIPGSFSLLSTNVSATLAGPIADVTLRQRYQNDGTEAIEAIYVFPTSTRAAVYHMEMHIGDRVITAEIQEKRKAKQNYEQAKSEGKRASLLQQDKPNVFTMNVANISPGESIDILMKYNEFLLPESGVYTFVYPTVVGPRYSSSPAKHNTIQNPYLAEGQEAPYQFDLQMEIRSPLPIKQSECLSHQVNADYKDQSRLLVKLKDSDKSKGNKDFIFTYQLAGERMESGTLFYESKDENFFLTLIEPPVRVSIDQVTPREFIFIVDVSGSMHGFPIEVTKQLMDDLLSTMRPEDYFNVVLFAGNSKMLAPQAIPASSANIKSAKRLLTSEYGGGGTELLSAVQKAMAIPKHDEHGSRSLVIITDGYINVEEACLDYIQNHLNQANFYAFGIGSSVNRYLIEGIAHVGRGESFVVTEAQMAKQKADQLRQYIESPILTDVSVDFRGIDVYDVIPRQIPDLTAERPLYAFGKYKGEVNGSIEIKGKLATGDYHQKMYLDQSQASQSSIALKYLWAREKLKYLSDYASVSRREKYKEEIIDLGLKYNLLSQYTSFVAIDEQIVTEGQSPKVLRQALPLPAGVSHHAIGFEMSSETLTLAGTPENEETLFVHFISGQHQIDQSVIESYLKSQIVSTDEEARDLLDGNPLHLSIDKDTGLLEVSDELGLLSDDMIVILEQHLYGLVDLCPTSVTLTLQLLWL